MSSTLKRPRRPLARNIGDVLAGGPPSTFDWSPLVRVKEAAGGGDLYRNPRFTVVKRLAPSGAPDPSAPEGELRPLIITHLMVQATDGSEPRWEELQLIKDELCGLDCEAVQLHPSHHRRVDTKQSHLWVLPSGMQYKVGFEVQFKEEKTLG